MTQEQFISDLALELLAMASAPDRHHRGVNATTVACMIAERIAQVVAVSDPHFIILPSGRGINLDAIAAWEGGDEDVRTGKRGIVVTFVSGQSKQYKGDDGATLTMVLIQHAQRKGGVQ